MIDRSDDLLVLDVLDRMDRQGQTASEIAKVIGRTRSSVCGIVFRVRTDDARVTDLSRKPENKDGGMPARWWAA